MYVYGCFCSMYLGDKFLFHPLVFGAHKILGFFWSQVATAIYGLGETQIVQSCFLMSGARNMNIWIG